MGVSNKQNVSTCLSFGVIAENRSKMGAILNFKMAATRGREYVEGIFSSSPWVGLPVCKVSCLLQKLNDSGGYVVFATLLYRIPWMVLSYYVIHCRRVVLRGRSVNQSVSQQRSVGEVSY